MALTQTTQDLIEDTRLCRQVGALEERCAILEMLQEALKDDRIIDGGASVGLNLAFALIAARGRK